jgi:hypothetical protein
MNTKQNTHPGVAIASVACSLPCVLVTVYAVWLCFFLKHTTELFERFTGVASIAVWLSPIALAAIILAVFARGFRAVCFIASVVYFAGWITILIFQ